MTLLQVGLTRDFLEKAPRPWEMGLTWLQHESRLDWSWMDQWHEEVKSEQIKHLDAVIAWTPRWTTASLQDAERLMLIARWGVGYDHVDLKACTDAGIMVTITPDAVRRPVAAANVTMIMALSTGLFARDEETRAGLWQTNSMASPGTGLKDKVLGSIGFGNVAKETFRLMSGFEMNGMVYSPRANPVEAQLHNVRIADLETVLAESDYLMINCPLTGDTFHLLGEAELRLMKPTAYLINVARGAIIDEPSLVQALREKRIAGAGLDVFETEPLPQGHPFTSMKEVILAPHSLALSRDLYLGMEQQLSFIFDCLLRGEIPPHIVNREVLQSSLMQRKLQAWKNRRDNERGLRPNFDRESRSTDGN